MNDRPMSNFLQALAENGELRRDFVQLAARYGIDFSSGQLTDEQLDSVAGGADSIEAFEGLLATLGDDAQLAQLDLQNKLQQQQQTLQAMSNLSKMLHDTALAIVRKVG